MNENEFDERESREPVDNSPMSDEIIEEAVQEPEDDKFRRLRQEVRDTASSKFRYHPRRGWQPVANPAPFAPHNPRDDAPPRSSGESTDYQWNFQDYSQLDAVRNKGGGRKGLLIFAISLVCVLAICFVSIPLSQGATPSRNPVEPGLAPEEALTIPEAEEFSMALTAKPQESAVVPATGGKLTIPQIAKLVSPSIVGITVYQNNRFYEPIATASGIILSADGYVITNAHVVAGGTDYQVQFTDEDATEAFLVGMDASTDLAVLKIDREGLVPATFGDSGQIEVGEPVVAIGNLKGMLLAGSVTHGIISAKSREIITDGYALKLLQSDAAINPGSSGGALVNEYGHVIGITTSKIVAEGFEGISFSIPITDAKTILDDIIRNGRVTGRAAIGFTVTPVTTEDSMRYDVPMGLEIREIFSSSDLNGKDAQLGDIVTEVNGIRVYTLLDLQKILVQHDVGDTIKMKLYRRISIAQSTEVEVEIRLMER